MVPHIVPTGFRNCWMARFQQAQMPKTPPGSFRSCCRGSTARSEPQKRHILFLHKLLDGTRFQQAQRPKTLLAASGPVAVAPLLETKGAPTGFRNCWMALFQQARMPKTRAGKLPLLEAKHQNAAAHCFYWVFETAGWHVSSRPKCLKSHLADTHCFYKVLKSR